MKKTCKCFLVVMLVILSVCVLPSSLGIAYGDSTTSTTIMPFAVSSITVSKSVSGKSVTGYGQATFGTTESSASITIYLQKNTSGTWTTVQTGATKYGYNVSTLVHSSTFTATSSGTYRIKVTATSTNTKSGYSSSFTLTV